MDLVTARLEAFAAMELARDGNEFRVAAEARDRLAVLGVRVRYTRPPRGADSSGLPLNHKERPGTGP